MRDTMPVTINGGYVMRAWYDITSADLARREDEGGLRASQRADRSADRARKGARHSGRRASSWPAFRKAAR